MTLTLTEREVGWLVGLLTSAAAEVDAAALSESMVQPLTTEEAADLVDAAAWARRLLAQIDAVLAAPQEPAQSPGDLVGLSHIRSCFERARAPQRGCTCGCDECSYCVAKAAPPEPNATPLGRVRLAIKALADEAFNRNQRKRWRILTEAVEVCVSVEGGDE